MDQIATDQEPRPTVMPYFFPPGFDFAALPKAVQLAVVNLVVPLYELALGGATSLERSIGASFAVIATLELDQQFEVCARLNFSGTATEEERATRDRLTERLLRLIGAKTKTAAMLSRLQALREQREREQHEQREQGDG